MEENAVIVVVVAVEIASGAGPVVDRAAGIAAGMVGRGEAVAEVEEEGVVAGARATSRTASRVAPRGTSPSVG